MNSINNKIQWAGNLPSTVKEVEQGWLRSEWDVRPGEVFSAMCRLPLAPMTKPFWCIPGLFWGDNQQDSTGQYYPRFKAGMAKPERFQSFFWEFDVWRAAQPVVALHDGEGWSLLEIAPHGECGNQKLKASIGFEYEDGVPCLVASLPASERPYRPVGHDYTAPIKGVHSVTAPGTISWSVRAVRLEGRQASLLNFLRDNYHSSTGRSACELPGTYALATRNALLNWHYHPVEHYFRYTVAFDRVGQQIAESAGGSLDRHEMPLGWASGWLVFEALVEWGVRKGDRQALASVFDTWNGLVKAGVVSPSGYWWTRYAPTRGGAGSMFASKLPGGLDGNWMANPYHLHLRTLGDSLWRAARLLRRHSAVLPFRDELRGQIVAQAGKVAELARRGWPLPLSVDARTGEPAGLKGTAGMIWILVWSELAKLGQWEDVGLIREGLDHYRASVESGQLYGAPEDVGECVTSEDIYIAVNTYLEGYKITGRPEDLATCIQAAEWLYLWRKSFDHELDPRTLLGVYGLCARGGDLASFKNNHLHVYGLDIDSSLRELAAITGDGRWTQLADDHWAYAAQLTPLIDGQFNAYEGMVAEQFYFIDWSPYGNSVGLLEKDARHAACDVGAHYRNHGNVAGFSHVWCTAFVLRAALAREEAAGRIL